MSKIGKERMPRTTMILILYLQLLPITAFVSEQDRAWTREMHTTLMDQVFQLDPISAPDPYLFEYTWTASLRVQPDEIGLEWSVFFRERRDGSVAARVVRAIDKSVWQQLKDLSGVNPKLTLEEVKGLVRIDVRNLTDQDCPRIRSILGELEELPLRARPRRDLPIHATTYEFLFRWLGNRMSIDFQAPRVFTDLDLQDPLIAWTEKVRTELVERQACEADQ